jgi:molybdate transport system substrate-binding protein
MKATTAVRAFAAIASLLGALGSAHAAEIRVYTSGAPAPAAKAIAEDFAKDTGDHPTFTVAQPAAIQRDLTAGDHADLVILPRRVVMKLTDRGVLRKGSAIDIARVGIGVVVRDSAAAPNIADAAAIRKLLLDAPSIVYPDPHSGGGSAGRTIARMIDKMGLTESVRPKLTLVSAIGGGVALVGDGKAAVGFFNISEIMPIQGVSLVGPLPPELQSYIVFSAAIPAANETPEPALAFIKRLADPTAREVWQKAGLEPEALKP